MGITLEYPTLTLTLILIPTLTLTLTNLNPYPLTLTLRLVGCVVYSKVMPEKEGSGGRLDEGEEMYVCSVRDGIQKKGAACRGKMGLRCQNWVHFAHRP